LVNFKDKRGGGGIVNYLKHKGGKMFFSQKIYDMTRAFIRESLLDLNSVKNILK